MWLAYLLFSSSGTALENVASLFQGEGISQLRSIGMKVKELIDKLREFPPEDAVWFDTADGAAYSDFIFEAMDSHDDKHNKNGTLVWISPDFK